MDSTGGQVLLGRSMLDTLVDEIEVKPGETEEGRPCHIIRVRGALDQAFELLSRRRQVSLVAGACYNAIHNALAGVLVRRWGLPGMGRRPR